MEPLAVPEISVFYGSHLPAKPIWPRLGNLAWILSGWSPGDWMLCPCPQVTVLPSSMHLIAVGAFPAECRALCLVEAPRGNHIS